MERDLGSLSSREFDVLIIGGGIYGAAIAWEAASRGLAVALVEKNDFGAGTSANSLKIIHGGFRYLQDVDLRRLRRSARERRVLMRIAPHLVHPMPTLIPTYGHGLRGREAMTAALLTYDVLTLDRNKHSEPQKCIPRGRFISADACRELLPEINTTGLQGAAVYYDAQVYNSERLVLAFVKSACRAGAVVANYAEAAGFLRDGNHIKGVIVTDSLTGESFDVRCALTINATGPWVHRTVEAALGIRLPRFGLAKAFNIVARRRLHREYGIGLEVPKSARTKSAPMHARVGTGGRYVFAAPWRGRMLVGTGYVAGAAAEDEVTITREEASGFISMFNTAAPYHRLTLDDITFVHRGLLPATGNRDHPPEIMNRPIIRDHQVDGLDGLVSVTGVKFTTARAVAERALDAVAASGRLKLSRSSSAETPLVGGDIERFDNFVEEARKSDAARIGSRAVEALVRNYGSEYAEVGRYLPSNARSPRDILRAQVAFAVKHEMARTLSDVVLRRTDLGSAGYPGAGTLAFCADVMGGQLGWTKTTRQAEIQRVNQEYPDWLHSPDESIDERLAD